jgi:hypothetical protein
VNAKPFHSFTSSRKLGEAARSGNAGFIVFTL